MKDKYQVTYIAATGDEVTVTLSSFHKRGKVFHGVQKIRGRDVNRRLHETEVIRFGKKGLQCHQ